MGRRICTYLCGAVLLQFSMRIITYDISAVARFVVILILFAVSVVPVRARQGGISAARFDGLTLKEIIYKGASCLSIGHNDSAIACYQAAASRYDEGLDTDEKKMCVDAMCNAGAMVFVERHDYVGAYAMLIKALGVAEDNSFDYIKPYIYLNLAGVHTVFGDSTMSDRLRRKAFRIGKRLKDTYIYKMAFVELVYTAAAGGNFSAIRNELADFGHSWQDIGISRYDYTMFIYLGISAYLKDHFAKALRYYDQADSRACDLLEADLYHLIIDMLAARVYSAQGKYTEAVARLKPNIGKNIYQHALNDAYRALSGLYAKAGEANLAREYKVKSLLMEDTALDYDGYMRLRDVEQRYLPVDVTGRATVLGDLGIAGRTAAVIAVVIVVASVILAVRRKRQQRMSEHTAANAGTRNNIGNGYSAPDEKTQETAREIRKFMETSSEIYSQDFSLEKLAQRLGVHTRTVSRAINDVLGVNFSTLLSQYRVKKACRMLSSDDYSNVTIQAIATDVGFKSRTNFASVFKKLTGLSPNEYQKKVHGGMVSELTE